jgi:hypothetical protein
MAHPADQMRSMQASAFPADAWVGSMAEHRGARREAAREQAAREQAAREQA